MGRCKQVYTKKNPSAGFLRSKETIYYARCPHNPVYFVCAAWR
jgi:hypothetical protein